MKLDLSPSHALYVLEQAIEDRRITRADLDRYGKKMREEISEIEARLRSLRDATVKAAKRVFDRRGEVPVPHVKGRSRGPKRAKRSSKPVSAEVVASRKLQGRYIAAVRQLPKTRRARFAAIAKREGREAAIAAIRKAAGK
jgi:hypothetical protein